MEPKANPSPNGSTPDYERPPVVETILGVQFKRLPRFTNAHSGLFWHEMGTDDWPAVADAQALPPQFERFEPARWRQRPTQLVLTQEADSRLQMKNKDGDRMVQVQNGRLHFNWLGIDGREYPRYPTIREGFDSVLKRFTDFVAQRNLGEFRPNQWEVTYINHIPRGTVWNSPDDWGFFRPFGNWPRVEVVQGESFTGEWHFVIPDQRGRLHVQWQHGLQSVAKKEQELIGLTFTARGPLPEDTDTPGVLAGIDLGRQTIVRSFRAFVSDEANKHWGLKG